MPVVVPPYARGQGHENGFDASARFESEGRAAIVKQVELHVPTAAVFLESALTLAVGLVFAAADDRQVRIEEMVARVAHEGEEAVEIAFQVIKENAADAAWFAA